ncbi:MAG: FAD-dependent oxidoreductase [Pirellulaceae bacterium]
MTSFNEASMKNPYYCFVAVFLALVIWAEKTACGQTVLVECEAFDSYGGWFNDSQFMDLMGSPFLLAHGMGTLVADAKTTVTFPEPGEYRIWARTRDWVAPWKVEGSPGKFQILINGQPLDATFGTEGEDWHWQDGGTVAVGKVAEIALHDLTGFDGRCDALIFSRDSEFVPPSDLKGIQAIRNRQLGVLDSEIVPEQFDVVVIGGGFAGTAAAITAARKGLSVALVQDRPVLGGNGSSEVRVWPEGHVNLAPFYRVGDVVMEMMPDRRADSKNAQGPEVFDDQRKMMLAQAEPNLKLFLNFRMNHCDVANAKIQSVRCQNTRSGKRIELTANTFVDCTGDGTLGFLAGADFEQTPTGHMGASNLWNIQCLCEEDDLLEAEVDQLCEEAAFPRCPWAVDFHDKPFPGRTDGPQTVSPDNQGTPISLGNWFWESGFDLDPIADMERIRDQNFRAAYGAWDTIKNVEKRYPAHRLNWVAYVAGKRESRRLMGDVVLSADDFRTGREWVDGCFPMHVGDRYAFAASRLLGRSQGG